MSNFSAKLAELLEKKKMSQAELSRTTGINDALISRWINGQQKYVSSEDLAKICTSISSKPTDRAELIRAHLYDEIAGPGSELLDIRIRGEADIVRMPAPYETLPLKFRKALDTLAREIVIDADVRSVVLGLAGLLETPTVISSDPSRIDSNDTATVPLPAEVEKFLKDTAQNSALQPPDDKHDPASRIVPDRKAKHRRASKRK